MGEVEGERKEKERNMKDKKIKESNAVRWQTKRSQ